MKNVFFLVLIILFVPKIKAQGTITFFNSGIDRPDGIPYDALVRDTLGGPFEDQNFTVGLYFNGMLVSGSRSTFMTGRGAGLWFPIFDLPIPGSPPGSTPTLEVRGWVTAAGSYENAQATGQIIGRSAPFTVPPLGGGTSPNAPSAPTLTGFAGFVLPEPSVYALSVLSLAAVAMLRRRK